MTKSLKKKANLLFSGDISKNYLIKAKDNINDVYFIRLDSHYLPFEKNCFDVVTITEVLEHLVSPYRALTEINRVLKTNGTLVLSVPNSMTLTNIFDHLKKEDKISKSAHLYSFNFKSIIKLLRFTGFTEEEIQTTSISLLIPDWSSHISLIEKFLNNLLPRFSNHMIVKAKKKNISLWDEL